MKADLLVALSLAALAPALEAQERGRPDSAAAATNPGFRFEVNDARASFEQGLGRDLVLRVTPAVDAEGRHFGWDFTVTDRRLRNSPNFFYECLCGHGPRPHDLYAWHFAEGYYPATRELPVYGYPFEVGVACQDCAVTGGSGTEVTFSAGTVAVSWRRLTEANPRQRRISDVRAP